MKKLLKLMLMSVAVAAAVCVMYEPVSADTASGSVADQDYTCGDYTYRLDENDDAVITKYNGSETAVVIPDALDEYRVTAVGDKAFEYKRNIVSVEVPEGITAIGKYAFHECTGMKDIKLPDSLEKIEPYTFAVCERLRYITVPEGVKRLEEGAFISCSRMTAVSLPQSLEYIGGSAFYNCIKLTEIDIPEGVTEIGTSAFSWCSSLRKVEIPEGVTTVSKYMFSECSGITEVVLPYTVTRIEEGAFAWCENLKKVNIPQDTNYIGKGAFAQCESLGKISVPRSVTSIGKNAFRTQICGLVIYCRCGSYAEKYALENDFEFAGNDYSSNITPAKTYKNGKIVKKCRTCGKILINRTIPRASTLGLWATEYQYTGSRIQPQLKIKDENGKKLMQNTDYKVSYVTNGRSIGKQTVKITYRGRYTGTRKLSYSKVSNAKGYKIYVKEPGSSRYRCRLTKDVMVKSVTHKGLKRGKTYRYKIRAYKTTNGTTEYGPYSSVKTVKVK